MHDPDVATLPNIGTMTLGDDQALTAHHSHGAADRVTR
jgi:hypothetical protein